MSALFAGPISEKGQQEKATTIIAGPEFNAFFMIHFS